MSEKLVSIAILKAKADKHDALRQGLVALIEPTRKEPGCLDYVLFEAKDSAGTFYMREAFKGQAALDSHMNTPHFLSFSATLDSLLEEPLKLIFLEQISS